jgi:BlaI family transcriptional regulator, penicillinase repressor
MTGPLHTQLSRRETQIMDVIFQMGEATAADILERLPEPPSYSAVRALLTILEEKGHLTHRRDGARYIYVPTLSADKAKKSALRHMLDTFFGGGAPQVVATLLSTTDLSKDDLDELGRLIEQAKQDEEDSQ